MIKKTLIIDDRKKVSDLGCQTIGDRKPLVTLHMVIENGFQLEFGKT
jgi:hypothetical protein